MDLKDKLKKKRLVIGSWITLGDSSVAEIMAKSGFQWLTIDMEHSAITLEQAQQLIRVIDLSGVTPLVRVGKNEPEIIKKVMDYGAHGVIVPLINTKEDAERAVSSVKYPPEGRRGVGLARAQGYGLEFEKYKAWVNKKSIVIVQIEHIDAVNNLEEILGVKGIDAFMVGPYDLSASLGVPGEFNAPSVKKAMQRIKEVSQSHNIASGFHVIPPDAKELARKIKEGYRFIAFSLDTMFLGIKCREELSKVKRFVR